MDQSTVDVRTVPLPQAHDVLTDILRQGAQQLLAQAIEAEVADWIDRHQDCRDAAGRRQVVRNGHLPAQDCRDAAGRHLNPIFDLFPPQTDFINRTSETEGQDLLRQMNRRHQEARPGDSRLDARIASYELAAQLQLSAPEVLDISRETPATQRMYGLDQRVTEDHGRNCLIARRLLEHGVRFVQVWRGAGDGFPGRHWYW